MLGSDDLADFVRRHALPAEIIRLDVETPTVDAAADALGVSSDEIIKSLVFETGRGPVLAIGSGNLPIHPSRLAAYLGVSHSTVSLASPARVLDLTGFPVGAVPPFGYAEPLDTIMDVSIFAHDWVYGGGGETRTLLKVSPEAIRQTAKAAVVELQSEPGA